MEQATSTLVAAAVGALAGICGGMSLEWFKRRQDRHGVAMALAGAIEAELWMIKRRKHVEFFRGALVRIRNGEPLTFYGFVKEDQAKNAIADAFMEKFGMLPGTMPARTIKFFQAMWGIRIDVSRVVAGEFGGDRGLIASVIEQDLELMAELEVLGQQLALDLREFAGGLSAWAAGRWRKAISAFKSPPLTAISD